MKTALLQALCSRFSLVEDNPAYTVASLLDPRYKTRSFSPVLSETVISEVKARLAALRTPSVTTQPEDPPVHKKMLLGESTTSLFDCVDDLLHSNNTQCIQRDALSDESSIELDRYLAEPLIPRTSDMLAWWEQNKGRFPLLASVARTYPGPPASSVNSERLFSTAGKVITEHRARLLPDNAERLIFLKYNSSLIKVSK